MSKIVIPCDMKIFFDTNKNEILFEDVDVILIKYYYQKELEVVLKYNTDISFFRKWFNSMQEGIGDYKRNIEIKQGKISWECLGCFIRQIYPPFEYYSRKKAHKITFMIDNIKEIKN